jgi:hypothetical protein
MLEGNKHASRKGGRGGCKGNQLWNGKKQNEVTTSASNAQLSMIASFSPHKVRKLGLRGTALGQ